MRKFFRNNGLTICLLTLFVISIGGQIISGRNELNEYQIEHGQSPLSISDYLESGEFLEVTFENWESEFLQMALYVWLTSFLFQRGSAESKDPDAAEEVDEDPRFHNQDPDAPSPVRKGGLLLKLYEHSLVLVLAALFLISFALHLVGSTRANCRDQLLHGNPCESIGQHLMGSQFWFESFQNWQSEFLSIAVLVVLSIFLRQRGSPESKPVHASSRATGK